MTQDVYARPMLPTIGLCWSIPARADHAEHGIVRMGSPAPKRLVRVACVSLPSGSADTASAVPKVDLVVGPDGYRNLPELLRHAVAGGRTADVELRGWEHYEDIPQQRVPGLTAFITVQRGCDYRCTFCIVPTTRGPERSRQMADVVNEARRLTDEGVSEVTLLGQTVNSYHDGNDLRRCFERSECSGFVYSGQSPSPPIHAQVIRRWHPDAVCKRHCRYRRVENRAEANSRRHAERYSKWVADLRSRLG